MIRTAAELSRDLRAPRPLIYWMDMLASAATGYSALIVASSATSLVVLLVAGIVSVLALYRALSFIHEVSHMKSAALPHFRVIWNVLVGIPMLVPSFMYDTIHHLHHAKTRYGTRGDPEYLPLALMRPWTLPAFVLVALLAPIGLLARFAVLAPLSLAWPNLRRLLIARYSSLTINPSFRRRAPEDGERKTLVRLEVSASAWAIALLVLAASGTISLHAFLIGMAIGSAVAVLNQVRTLVAHRWENEGEVMSITAQYLDSVNVPPPALLPVLWAPVGLRYHALHHLLPALPYHALGEAHRRLSAELHAGSPYHKANHASLFGLICNITQSTLAKAGRKHD
jgi:fatty acid desaturase